MALLILQLTIVSVSNQVLSHNVTYHHEGAQLLMAGLETKGLQVLSLTCIAALCP